VAEGGGLLNRYTVQSRIKGSNPFLSATLRPAGFGWQAILLRADALGRTGARSMHQQKIVSCAR
jgi:hypothetical protein